MATLFLLSLELLWLVQDFHGYLFPIFLEIVVVDVYGIVYRDHQVQNCVLRSLNVSS
jgi:hypothetical protein